MSRVPSRFREKKTDNPTWIRSRLQDLDVDHHQSATISIHDWIVYRLSSLIHSVGHRVKIHKVTPASDYEHGDVEIKDYVVFPHGGVNRLPPRPLILDVTLTDTIWTVFWQGFWACMTTQCRLWVYNSEHQRKKHDTQFPPMVLLNLTTFWKMRSGRKYSITISVTRIWLIRLCSCLMSRKCFPVIRKRHVWYRS